jgi:hypothetical protein
MGACKENQSAPLDSMKGGKVLAKLDNHQLLQKDESVFKDT